jgi:hypothetical protein
MIQCTPVPAFTWYPIISQIGVREGGGAAWTCLEVEEHPANHHRGIFLQRARERARERWECHWLQLFRHLLEVQRKYVSISSVLGKWNWPELQITKTRFMCSPFIFSSRVYVHLMYGIHS